jgi:hypothetical protein
MHQRLTACLMLAAALGLGGCAEKTAWVKPGATPEDFARDSYQCERDARATAGERGPGLAGGGGLAAAFESGGYQSGCLRRRGWVRATPTGEAPVAAAEPELSGAPTLSEPPAAAR